jgi:hypothetical protein
MSGGHNHFLVLPGKVRLEIPCDGACNYASLQQRSVDLEVFADQHALEIQIENGWHRLGQDRVKYTKPLGPPESFQARLGRISGISLELAEELLADTKAAADELDAYIDALVGRIEQLQDRKYKPPPPLLS